MFNTASAEEILAGKVTDIYFERAAKVLREKGVKKRVRAEFVAKSLPDGWKWAVLAGIDEVLVLLDGLRERGIEINARGLPEGTIFRPWDIVLEVEGEYSSFAVFETALLGFICQATGITTKAARCRIAAGECLLLSFGARRMHPALAPLVERCAYLGGCDGISAVLGAERLGIPATGTMPHALILVMGDCVEATRAFRDVLGGETKVVSLVDTFNDERFETLRVAEALGGDLHAVRFDTPASRRGDMRRLVIETRWELEQRGYGEVKIFVSGGMDEKDLLELSPVVDGFGIGTSISAGRTVDFSMDIIEVEGVPLAKRGKRPGAKDVYGCPGCSDTRTVPLAKKPPGQCECAGEWRLLTVQHQLGADAPSREEVVQVRKRIMDALRILPNTE